MEKYGVMTDPEIKTASGRMHCPECGAVAEDHGVLICPNHGSEPFEYDKCDAKEVQD